MLIGLKLGLKLPSKLRRSATFCNLVYLDFRFHTIRWGFTCIHEGAAGGRYPCFFCVDSVNWSGPVCVADIFSFRRGIFSLGFQDSGAIAVLVSDQPWAQSGPALWRRLLGCQLMLGSAEL